MKNEIDNLKKLNQEKHNLLEQELDYVKRDFNNEK